MLIEILRQSTAVLETSRQSNGGCILMYVLSLLVAINFCFADTNIVPLEVKSQTDEFILRGNRSLRTRIYNGEDASNGRYPYFAITEGSPYQCGGFLVADNIVLTAAHCKGAFSQVAIGKHSIFDTSNSYESIRVRKEIPHPQYAGKPSHDNDFMIVVLSEKAATSPVCLADASTELNIGDDMTVIGFGKVDDNNSSYRLQETDVQYITSDDCFLRYFGQYFISDNMMCATSEEGNDACQGDSGGPLIKLGRNSAEDIVLGIVSWGVYCGENPGVYSRITAQRDWILRMVRHYGGKMCPTSKLTLAPTPSPTKDPTRSPTSSPTHIPSKSLTQAPTTSSPTASSPMTSVPTTSVLTTSAPVTSAPTTYAPTTRSPTSSPTHVQMKLLTQALSKNPGGSPTLFKTEIPTQSSIPSTNTQIQAPSEILKNHPTRLPSQALTNTPIQAPSEIPTNHPVRLPSHTPTNIPIQAPSELPTNYLTSVLSESPTTSCNFMQSSANTSTRQCEIKDSRSSFTINGIYTSCSKITYPSSLMFCKFSKVRSECPLLCSCKNFSSLELCEDDDSFSVDFKTCHNFNEGDCECEVGDGSLIEDHCPKKCNVCSKDTSICKIIDYETSNDCTAVKDNPELCSNSDFESDCLLECSCI